MSLWHLLLYVVAAIVALRSFIQLVTNYRSEFEQQLVSDELRRQAEIRHQQSEEDDEAVTDHEHSSSPH